MSNEWKAPQGYEDGAAPAIELVPVESNQVAGIGYRPETRELAVTFKSGAGAVYVYPGVSPELHAEFMAAESKGKFHGERIKPLRFLKYRAPERPSRVPSAA